MHDSQSVHYSLKREKGEGGMLLAKLVMYATMWFSSPLTLLVREVTLLLRDGTLLVRDPD